MTVKVISSWLRTSTSYRPRSKHGGLFKKQQTPPLPGLSTKKSGRKNPRREKQQAKKATKTKFISQQKIYLHSTHKRAPLHSTNAKNIYKFMAAHHPARRALGVKPHYTRNPSLADRCPQKYNLPHQGSRNSTRTLREQCKLCVIASEFPPPLPGPRCEALYTHQVWPPKKSTSRARCDTHSDQT